MNTTNRSTTTRSVGSPGNGGQVLREAAETASAQTKQAFEKMSAASADATALMKDSYSFDLNAAGLDASYEKHHAAYRKIFSRCGLEFLIVEAHSGAMGGRPGERSSRAERISTRLMESMPRSASRPISRFSIVGG
mgnify:CR=1 FL=1